MDSYRYITVEARDGVCCVRLKNTRLEENEIPLLGDELLGVCDQGGWRKVALSLGPEPPDCLYSVFLAKLIAVRNAYARHGARLVLCDLNTAAYSVFAACLLDREFTFAPTLEAGVALLRAE